MAKGDIVDLKALQEQKEREAAEEECELRIKEAIPNISFVEPEYPHGGDNDRCSLRIMDFKQSYDYSRTKLA